MEDEKFREAARRAVKYPWLAKAWNFSVLYLLLLIAEGVRLWQKKGIENLSWWDALIVTLLLLLPLSLWMYVRKKNKMIRFCMTHDTHTHLPLRYWYRETSQKIIDKAKDGDRYAFVIIRLDQYHLVNFVMGLPTTDEVIKNLYYLIEKEAKSEAVLAQMSHRMLGVMFQYDSVSEIHEFIDIVQEKCRNAYKIEDITIDVSVHVGVALYPKDGEYVPDLVKRAIHARHVADKNHVFYAFYDAEKDIYDESHLRLLTEMRTSMKTGALKLHYQPKYNTKTKCIDEVEALLRWEHPERGMIPPNEFLPIVEQTDFINDLSAWILEEAIKQLQAWGKDDIRLAIAVNLSVKNLVESKIVNLIPKLIDAYGVSAERLVVEVTETEIMQNPITVIENLRALHNHGISIAIDDFGTGMSSMEYLKILPVNEIKLDSCFIFNLDKEPRDRAIVESIHSLGQKLGIDSVAEGCETKEIFDILVEVGCTRIQGYYISKALASGDLLQWIEDSDWKLPQD